MNNKCRRCLPKKRIKLPDGSMAEGAQRVLRGLLIGTALMGSVGCTVLGARPWDHDLLAQRAMQIGAYPIEESMDDHIYFSKEASSGGRSFAGGGCGCN